jgi:N6-adenosine-specific RNA methylase IME4
MVTKYKVILADPPWSYSNSGARGAALNEYKTMSIDDICALPVSTIADDNCVLLLWATNPLIPEALRVCKAWGFEYVTKFPWIKLHGSPQINLFGEWQYKPQYGVGFWVRGCSEDVFICKRGNVTPPELGWVGILSENFFHSRKPDNIYEYAESLPAPRLEMFARRRREGWDVFGDEVEGSICLPTVLAPDKGQAAVNSSNSVGFAPRGKASR